VLEKWRRVLFVVVSNRIRLTATVDPELTKCILNDMVEEAGVKLLLHSWGTRALVEKGKVTGVLFESKSGRQAVLGEIIIDGTGDGDLLPSAGAEFDATWDAGSRSSMLALVFRLGNCDYQRYCDFRESQPEKHQELMKELARVQDPLAVRILEGEFPEGSKIVVDARLSGDALEFRKAAEIVDGTVASYFSDHFMRQLKAGSMVQDYLGLCPKPSRRIEGGGATGGLCLQAAWEAVASGRMNVVVAFGWETMSRVNTWKGNEFIALASDTNFDYPLGGFYTGYYAMMVRRHMHEFGTTVEQLARVSIKNHGNAVYNPYAQQPAQLTIEDVRSSAMVSDPLTMLDVCAMSDGAAVAILASEEMAARLTDRPK